MITPVDLDPVKPEYYMQPWEGPLCPRVIAGKHCRRDTRCICQVFNHDILDHVSLWRDEKGRKVLTAEPYQMMGDVLVKYIQACAELGLRVIITGGSPYYPGATVMIRTERSDPPVPGM